MQTTNSQWRAAKKLRDRFDSIQAVALDLDGVLTDGRVTVPHVGDAHRTFSSLDILGVALLGRAGIQTAIVSSESSAHVSRLAENLRIPFVVAGSSDKAAALRTLADQLNLPVASISYMGDDLDDLPAMELCGLCACPSTAVDEVLRYVGTQGLVASRPGGGGAVRELAEALLIARQISPRDVALMR